MVLMSKTILNFDPSDYFSLTIHFFRYAFHHYVYANIFYANSMAATQCI